MDVDYSCYEGREVTGGSDVVLSRGRVVVRDGEWKGAKGRGRFLKRVDRRLRAAGVGRTGSGSDGDRDAVRARERHRLRLAAAGGVLQRCVRVRAGASGAGHLGAGARGCDRASRRATCGVPTSACRASVPTDRRSRIYEYDDHLPHPAPSVPRPGWNHVAFQVPDVAATLDAVVATGGGRVGEVVTTQTRRWSARDLVLPATDPEGNLVELPALERRMIDERTSRPPACRICML